MAFRNIEDRRAYDRQWHKERREWLRSHKFCVRCKTQDAYTLAGRYYCYECAEKERGHPLPEPKWDDEPKEPKISRFERQGYGLCYRCGAPLDGAKKRNGDKSKLCCRCYEKEIKVRSAMAQRPIKPFSNSPLAWAIYHEKMARYEKKREEAALRKEKENEAD
jgi:hypothetical protein